MPSYPSLGGALKLSYPPRALDVCKYPPPPIRKSKVLPFGFSGDTNGLCYWLGTNLGTQAWTNPHTAGYMTNTMSTVFTGGMGPEKIVDRDPADNITSNEVPSGPEIGAWLTFDVGAGRKFQPNVYIGQGRNDNSQAPRNWELAGSNNVATNNEAGIEAANWATIDLRVDDRTMENLPGANPWAVYKVPSSSGFYRWLRIHQYAGNATSNFYLVAVEWEFYGRLTTG